MDFLDLDEPSTRIERYLVQGNTQAEHIFEVNTLLR